MSEVSDFEGIVKICANEKAKSRKTKVQWVDIYGKDPALEQYPFAKVGVEVKNVQYLSPNPVKKPALEYSEWFDNDTEIEQDATFTKSVETSDSVSYSFTEALKISYTSSLKVVIPFFEAGGQWSIGVDFSATQTKTETRTSKWERTQHIKVPPKKSVRTTLVITESEYNTPWIADIVIGPSDREKPYPVAIWFHKKIDFRDPKGNNKHYLWFVQPPWISCYDQDLKALGNTAEMKNKLRNYSFSGYYAIYKAKGTFIGVGAVGCYIRMEEFPLRPKPVWVMKDYIPEDVPLSSYNIMEESDKDFD